jgi:DNA-binding NarL/FixJ family response regulator
MRRRLPDWTAASSAAPPAIPTTPSRRRSTAHSRYWTAYKPNRRRTAPVPCCASWGRPATASGERERRRLSVREEEVARLVAQGLSNAEVGERLFITTRTVATHLQHIYRRLELPSRAALIRYVLEDSSAAEVTSRDSR